MSRAGTIVWFAHHEVRLTWRDWLGLMSGRRRSGRRAALGFIAIALFLHGSPTWSFIVIRIWHARLTSGCCWC